VKVTKAGEAQVRTENEDIINLHQKAKQNWMRRQRLYIEKAKHLVLANPTLKAVELVGIMLTAGLCQAQELNQLQVIHLVRWAIEYREVKHWDQLTVMVHQRAKLLKVIEELHMEKLVASALAKEKPIKPQQLIMLLVNALIGSDIMQHRDRWVARASLYVIAFNKVMQRMVDVGGKKYTDCPLLVLVMEVTCICFIIQSVGQHLDHHSSPIRV